MNILDLLSQQFQHAFTKIGIKGDPVIKPAKQSKFGDFQANGIMAIAKRQQQNPVPLAKQVVAVLDLDEVSDKIEVAGPGFINIHLKSTWLAQQLQQMAKDNKLGIRAVEAQTIVVDYSSPNLAKEMHVGHLRSTIIGDAVVRILEFVGHKVIRQNHVGDWGTQFGMLLALMQSLTDTEYDLQLSDLESFYQQAKQKFDNDAEFANQARQMVVKLQSGDPQCLKLWRQFIDISLSHCQAVYDELNVSLTASDIRPESFYNSDLAQTVKDLARYLTVSDGAKCVFLPEFVGKDGQMLPLIVQKSDGGYLYATTDLAAIRYRVQQLKAQRILYFVDARQSLHLAQVFAVSRKAGFVDDNCSLEHHPFGTMLDKQGKPFKTRSGGTVKLIDLLTEAKQRALAVVQAKNPDLSPEVAQNIAKVVGIAAIKYADLAKNRTQDYQFDWQSMLALDGNTAPYLQYAYARTQSILRKAKAEGHRNHIATASIVITQPQERALVLQLLQFSGLVLQVAEQAYPHYLCDYLYHVAKLLMQFYEGCPILKPEVALEIQQSRLLLCELTAKVLATGLSLLGIGYLEKM